MSAAAIFAADLLTAVNAQRLKNGVPAFVSHPALEKAAQAWAEKMALNRNLNHGDFSARIRQAGYPSSTVAENIAWGQRDATECVTAWMSSRGHRVNMLNPVYRSMGAGAAQDSGGQWYWCADFGAAGIEPAPPTIPIPQRPGWLSRFLNLFR